MNSDDETEKVRVKFVTKLAYIRVTEMPIAVPTNLGRYGLSEVVNHLLDKSPPTPFEFLIENHLLRVPLEKYMQGAGLTGESVITLEYFPAAEPPEENEGPKLPDWVSSIHGCDGLEGFVAGCYDGVLRVFGEDVAVRASATAHQQPISVVRASHQQGQVLCLTGSKDRTIKTWHYQHSESKPAKGALSPRSLCRGHTNSVESLDFNSDGSKFASGDWEGGLCIWSTADGLKEGTGDAVKKKKGSKGNATPSLTEQTPLVEFKGHQQCVSALVWSKTTNQSAFTASWDHSIRTWDMERQDCIHTLNGSKVITSLAFSPENNLLASAHSDHRIRLWDSRGQTETLIKGTLASHKQWVSGVHWIQGMPFMLSSISYDGETKVWDIRSHIPLYTVKAYKNKGLCVHSQNQRIYTGGCDGTIKIFGMPRSISEDEQNLG